MKIFLNIKNENDENLLMTLLFNRPDEKKLENNLSSTDKFKRLAIFLEVKRKIFKSIKLSVLNNFYFVYYHLIKHCMIGSSHGNQKCKKKIRKGTSWFEPN